MILQIIGSGTSYGVPVISCNCDVCKSTDPRNHRFRPSALIKNGEHRVLIDAPQEFRLQALKYDIKRVDAVLITHCHADHVFGFDDLRVFNVIQKGVIECFLNSDALDEMKTIFAYIFEKEPHIGSIPFINFNEIKGKFSAGGIEFTPINYFHGSLQVTGFRFNDTAYITDCNNIPEESIKQLTGLKTLVIDALRKRPHRTHYCLSQSLAMVARLQPEKTYLTHLTHDYDYVKTNQELPNGVELAYDGLEIEID